ncbi:glycosyltransferase [Rhodococcus sp. A14]|uniref:glycosyltransferase n=1 Tax=Rhodococcus sp. A14 TaxID=1194106 RepID=UPI00141FEDB3|nr:glycosyltransferase family 1 protein [Rhodococcus sp. A14]
MSSRIVILSTADFNSSVWTNKQYMAVGLARHFDVTYIESLGLRTPTFKRSDLGRIFKRISTRVGAGVDAGDTGTDPVPDNLSILSPRVIPFHGVVPFAAINRKSLNSQLLSAVDISPGDVLWTFSPLTYGVEQHFSKVIYHSVDLLHTLPGVPSSLLLAAERNLIARADHVVASSIGVKEHLVSQGAANVLLWENVADVDRFSARTSSHRKPRAIFAGNLTPTKVDFGLLTEIADRGISLTLAGPVSIDGVEGERQLRPLLEHECVEYLGNLGLDDLADACGESMVGVIPYVQNEYTSGVFPLKVYEYLAAGLDVVSTPIQSLVAAAPEDVSILNSKTEFVDTVQMRIAEFDNEAAVRRSGDASAHSWSTRIAQAKDLASVHKPVEAQ